MVILRDEKMPIVSHEVTDNYASYMGGIDQNNWDTANYRVLIGTN